MPTAQLVALFELWADVLLLIAVHFQLPFFELAAEKLDQVRPHSARYRLGPPHAPRGDAPCAELAAPRAQVWCLIRRAS